VQVKCSGEVFVEIPNPQTVAVESGITVNLQEIFSRLHDQKSTSLKAAADYLLVSSYHSELQMTISPFSFETPE